MNLLAYVRMVLWSFLGIRRRAAASDELVKARPLLLAATAITLVVGIVFGLRGLVTFALAVS